MDTPAIHNQTARPLIDNGEQRAAALAAARKQVSANNSQEVAAAKVRSAEQFAQTREAVARAIGANTRLSITKSDNAQIFVYRAIDIDTGEIVNEWPQEQFLALIKGVREDVRVDVETTGLILDSEV